MTSTPLSFRSIVFLSSALTLCAALGSWPCAAHATTLRYLGVEALAVEAEVVVHARVRRVGTRMVRAAARWQTLRVAEVVVAEDFDPGGMAPGTELSVVLPGGQHRAGEHRVHGGATLREGEQVVLFLRRDAAPSATPRYAVTGMSMGVFHLEEGNRASRDMRDAQLLDASGAVRSGAVETLSLAALRAAVERARAGR